MKKLLSVVLSAALVVTSFLGATTSKVSAASAPVSLGTSQVEVGSKVSFAGKTWSVIKSNKIMLDGDTGATSKAQANYVGSGFQTPMNSASGGLGATLNSWLVSNITGENLKYLETTLWTVKTSTGRFYSTYFSKIGLPDYLDYKNNPSLYAYTTNDYWFVNAWQHPQDPYGGASSYIMFHTKAGADNYRDATSFSYVRPVLSINSESVWSGTGSVADPYVPVSATDIPDKQRVAPELFDISASPTSVMVTPMYDYDYMYQSYSIDGGPEQKSKYPYLFTGLEPGTKHTVTVRGVSDSMGGALTEPLTVEVTLPTRTTAKLGTSSKTLGSIVKIGNSSYVLVDDNTLVTPDTAQFYFASSSGQIIPTSGILNSMTYNYKLGLSELEKQVVPATTWDVTSHTTGQKLYSYTNEVGMPTEAQMTAWKALLMGDPASRSLILKRGFWLGTLFNDDYTSADSKAMYFAAAVDGGYGYNFNNIDLPVADNTANSGMRVIKIRPGTSFIGSGTTADPYKVFAYDPNYQDIIQAPATLTSSNVTATSATLTWSAVPGALGYKLTRNGQQVYLGAATSFTDTGLTGSNLYSYAVSAYDASGLSSEKTAVVVTPADQLVPPKDFVYNSLTTESVRFEWDPNGATSVELSQNGKVVYSGSMAYVVLTGLTPDTEYSFDLVGIRNGQRTAPVNLKVTTYPIPLDTPTGFSVTKATYDSLSLQWDNNPNVDTWKVTRDGQVVYEGPDTTFTETGLVEGTQYSYTLVGLKGSAVSPEVKTSGTTMLESDLAPKADPVAQNFRVEATGTTSVVGTWNAMAGAETYTIKRGQDIVAQGITELQFEDTGLTPNTRYTYVLIGVNSHGESIPQGISVTTLGEPPVAPTGLKAVRVGSDYASIQWGKVEGAKSYEVYRDGDVLVYSGPLTTFKDLTLAPESTYTYSVKAINDWGQGVSDETLTVTTPAEPQQMVVAPAPSQPTQFAISWSFKLIDGADQYVVERSGMTWTYTENPDGTYQVTFDDGSASTQTRMLMRMAMMKAAPSQTDLGSVEVHDGGLPFVEFDTTPSTTYNYNITAFKTSSDGIPVEVGEAPPVTITTPDDGAGTTIPDPSTGGNDGGSTDPGNGGNNGDNNGGGSTDPGNGGNTGGSSGNNGGGSAGGSTGGSSGGSTGGGSTGGSSSGNTGGNTVTPPSTGSESDGSNTPEKDNGGGITPPVVAGHDTDFTDVSRNFAENEIKALAAKGILTGYSDGSFQPKKEVSRAEFAIMLSRAFGYKDQNMVLIEKFKDLSVSAWYAPELSGALASGVTKGFTDETYRPTNAIPREQAAVMISNVLEMKGVETSGEAELSFTDSLSVIDWAKSSVAKSVHAGILKGYTDGSFKPKQAISRGEVAVIVYRLMETVGSK